MWKIEEVPPILSALEPVASRHGFLLSFYGSTARNCQGRDLDLIAVQKRCNAIPKYFLDDVAYTLRATVEGSEKSMFAELCALLKMGDGRLIDIQIRLSKCGPQDALDMYESGKFPEMVEHRGRFIVGG